MYRHWRTCFELLDEDGSKSVSREEFETLGFLFNFSKTAVRRIFEEFDVSGDSVSLAFRNSRMKKRVASFALTLGILFLDMG
jgi:Ca2+-binding EF-hand superfamily protein